MKYPSQNQVQIDQFELIANTEKSMAQNRSHNVVFFNYMESGRAHASMEFVTQTSQASLLNSISPALSTRQEVIQ